MRSILGRINIGQSSVNADQFKESITKLTLLSENKIESFIENRVALAQVPFHSDAITNTSTDSTLILISDSVIYNKDELVRDLNLSKNNVSDDLIIIKSYQKWKEKCVEHFVGDFAFAIWNKETQELFCARDHLGVKPFHHYFDKKSFIFSSDIAAILAQEDLKFSLDHQQIADTLSIIKSEKYRTTYSEIKSLPPAHYLTLKNDQLEIKKYWTLEQKKTLKKSDVEIIDEFKSLLFEAVRCRVKNNTSGAELSGGIDSSSVTAIASQFSKIKSFSHILPDNQLGKIHPFKDEREFIHLLTNHCNISTSHFITSEESLLKALKDHIKDFKSLSQQNFGMFSDQLYQKAKQEKISVLLSGFGGDEVVTSQSSGYLNEMAKNSEWHELKTDLKNQYPHKPKYTKAFLKLYLKSKLPGIYNLLSSLKFQKPWWTGKYKNLALNSDYEKKLKVKKRYFDYYQKLSRESLQERNIERITHPHVSQRLEYCSLIARKYGIEYRYPLLDIRLIEFYLSIPARLKARNGIGRYIMRRAIEGIVPEKIQWRNDKSGATIPTVFMRMINDKADIENLIKRSKTNEQIKAYIDLEKYEQWFHKLCNRTKESKYINPGAFYNYLKLILFIQENPTLFE